MYVFRFHFYFIHIKCSTVSFFLMNCCFNYPRVKILLSRAVPKMLNSKNNTKSKNIYCATFSLKLSVTNTTLLILDLNSWPLQTKLCPLCKGFNGFHFEPSFLVGIILALEKPFFLFLFVSFMESMSVKTLVVFFATYTILKTTPSKTQLVWQSAPYTLLKTTSPKAGHMRQLAPYKLLNNISPNT